MKKPGIVIHHPAMSQAYIDSLKGKALVDQIRRSHVQGNGWKDIGYHYIVHKDTDNKFKAFDGRSDNWDGAHTLGFNDWLGVSVAYGMGTNPPQEQLVALAKLIATLCKTYQIPIDSAHIKGHRDMPGHRSNACPGDQLYAKLPQVIEMAKKEAAGQLSSPPKQAPKQEQKPEYHITEIDVEIGDKKLKGMLIDDATYIHISALKNLNGIDVNYIPATKDKKHYVKVSQK